MILKTLPTLVVDNMRYTSTFIFEKKNKHIRNSGTGEERATNQSFLKPKDRRLNKTKQKKKKKKRLFTKLETRSELYSYGFS